MADELRADVLAVRPRFTAGAAPAQDLEFEVLIGAIRKAGHAVSACDAQASGLAPSALAAEVRRSAAPVVYWHLSGREDFASLLTAIESLKRPTSTLMLAGGDFATHFDLRVLERAAGLDAIVRGEPEITIRAVLDARRFGRGWQDECGLTVRRDNSVRRNAPRPLLEDLDELGPAADDLFDASRVNGGQRVLFSRGCGQRCQYCDVGRLYRALAPGRPTYWRGRSAGAIVDEIEHYVRRRNVTTFSFSSSVFFGEDAAGPAQVEAVARAIVDRRLPIRFSFVTQAGALYRNRTLLPLLKSAGLFRVSVGIDAALDETFGRYCLPFGRDEVVGALEALHANSILFVPAFIFYEPYLTLAGLIETLTFLEALAPWFRHAGVPYNYFLDQHLVNSVLHVRQEMPIYERLRQDGLANDVDPLQGAPAIGFQDPHVGAVFQVHREANRLLMTRLRPLLFARAVVARFPDLELFPIRLLRRIVALVERDPAADPRTLVGEVGAWAAEQVRGGLDEMLELAGVPSQERARFDMFRTSVRSTDEGVPQHV